MENQKTEQIEQTNISAETNQNLNGDDIKLDIKRDNDDFIDDAEINDSATDKVKSPYSARKVTALGMMDLALLTANANQIRFLITYNQGSPTYYLSLSLVIISLVLQVCVGIALIVKRQMKNSGKDAHLNKTNNLLTVGIFLITVINVFVASFTVTEAPKTA